MVPDCPREGAAGGTLNDCRTAADPTPAQPYSQIDKAKVFDMEIKLLEHVNLWTADLHRLESWYCEVLGLQCGYRPPFKSNGRWLYAGDIPMVHLLEVKQQPSGDHPTMEHFALRVSGLQGFLETLADLKIAYHTVRVPELRVFQVHLKDPDGNHMHLDFLPEEADALGFE